MSTFCPSEGMKLEESVKRGCSSSGICMVRYIGGCGACWPALPSGLVGAGTVGSGGTCQKSCWVKKSSASVTWYVERIWRCALK